MNWLSPITLSDDDISLQPLNAVQRDDFIEAAKDGELWNLWYTAVPRPNGMDAEIKRRLELQKAGSMLPFAVILKNSGKAVGMTTFMNADPVNKRVEIGSTWYRNSVQRTGLNTRCKLLMLTHAFEALGCVAVEFRTHFFNQQSRTAIERLGAKLDGVLRNHMKMENGTLRDTCVYSIIESEWPTVKAHLVHQITKYQVNT